MIAVVDYRKGNLKSVERGLIAAGADARITDDARTIERASAIVLPGVGAFADASATMIELGQMDVIRSRIDAGVPFLGICLGMHLMFEEGTEGAPEEDDETSSHNAPGLAVLPGVVDRMPRVDAAGRTYKVPHVGWNSVIPAPEATGEPDPTRLVESPLGLVQASAPFASPLFRDIDPGAYFYFTHSYIAPDTPATIALTTHATTFPCAVQFRDNAFGVQFHPEKSSEAGAHLLRNFVRIAGAV